MKVNGVTVGKGVGTGIRNTTVGEEAIPSNTTGNNNTTVGYQASFKNETGAKNTSLGSQALYENVSGSFNTAVGQYALLKVDGQTNTALGYEAGKTLTSGSNNTFIGYGAQPSAPNVSNEVTIGNDDVTKTRLKGDIYANGTANITKKLTCANLTMTGYPTTGPGSEYAPNMYIDDDGSIFKSGFVTNYITEEEVDKKLAIKDKLIEKLSARLDELEKRVK